MIKRHLAVLRLAAALTAAGLFAGCQSAPPQSKSRPGSDSQLAHAPTGTDPQTTAREAAPLVPEFHGPADPSAALSAVQNYTKQVAPQLNTTPNSDAVAGSSGKAPLAAPGNVQWMLPEGPPPLIPRKELPVQVVPLSDPVVDAQPSSANRKVSIASAAPASAVEASRNEIPVVREDDLIKTGAPSRARAGAPDLEAKLAAQIQKYPRDVWAHLDYQLFHFLRDEPVPQLESLTSLALEDRELVSAVLDGLTNFRNGLRADSNMLLSRKVKPLMEMSDRLRARSDLNIPTLTLCTKVDAFGTYEPIEPARFMVGKENLAIIYCEVENFSSIPSDGQKTWETHLTQEAVLYTESGMQVWLDKAGAIVDRSRNRRHDFFIAKKIKLPQNLTIGRYLLKVTVEDQQAKRVAEQTIPVEIAAQVDSSVAGVK
jgi:hypothetical protein